MTQPTGAFAPFANRVFLVLWLATVIGNIGTFLRDTISTWLVTELSTDPLAVAAVQAAATLPVFLLAIPAGVLADILDRRRFLIGVQVFLALVSLGLAVLAAGGQHTVGSLIALTFCGGVGAALTAPAWQAVVPDLVDRAQLRSAVALNSLGINVARSIGPALGGLLLMGFGAAVSYGVDLVSYLIVIAALIWWRRPQTDQNPLAEHFSGAFVAGLRYARQSPDLHRVMGRALVFFAFASAIWAYLPMVARGLPQGGPGLYGLMLGAVGVGAIGGAVLMPRFRSHLSPDGILLLAAGVVAAVMVVMALVPNLWAALGALTVAGAGWIAALTTLNGTAQAVLPNWVRGRALAIYLTVFNGAMTVGSLGWGAVASGLGVQTALLVAAASLALAGLVMHRVRLPVGEADLTPSHHWPEPAVFTAVPGDRGPVLITLEYRVPAANRAAFLAAIRALSHSRRRDGAFAWGIAEAAETPDLWLEWFQVPSWSEHLRQHGRVTRADQEMQARVKTLTADGTGPQVRHFLSG